MRGKTDQKPGLRFLPFDRLRYLIIILVVLQHAANSYGNLVPWWYVRDPYPSLNPFFDLFRQLPDIIMMPVLFFLAGFFALPSLREKGLGAFLWDKCTRLLWPGFICVTLIAPIINYIYHVSRSDIYSQNGYFFYWFSFIRDSGRFHIGFIESMDQFSHNFLWFVSLLFFFFLFFAVGHTIKGKLASRKLSTFNQRLQMNNEAINHDPKSFGLQRCYSWIIILSVGFISSLSYYIINSFMPYERWIIICNVIQFQSPRLIVYISYFSLGIYAYTQQWFLKKSPPGKLLFWGSLTVVLISIYFSLQQQFINGINQPGVSLLYSFTRYFLCLSFLFFLLLLTYRYFAQPSKKHNFLAEHSYYVYLTHLLLVVSSQLFFSQFHGLLTIIKFCCVFSFSIICSYLISCFLLKPFPRVSLIIIFVSCLVLGAATS
ncbi:MAG: acyltransferase family protein [Proteobacteria bacterium]|nr:acyltransferase family protein [Pseudomonadota bacterium]MBU1714065.1 acyltransferase family protein [Pseudomonadota bacterium]